MEFVLRNGSGVKMTAVRIKMTALLYCVLITSSLSTGAIAQQIVQGQTQVLNTVSTGDDYSSTLFSKGYDNSLATNVASLAINPVNGQYWTTNTARYPQAIQQAGYIQYPQYGGNIQTGTQIYPSQYGHGYHSQQFGSYLNQHPGFNAQYWTGTQHRYPAHVPVYKQHLPMMHHVPVRYPTHPVVYHRGYAMRRKYGSKGFLGGTGSGVVKGVLGAVLAGVVAGKVAKGK